MIFTGDIAQPYVGAFSITIPKELINNNWLGNLEGSLIDARGKNGSLKGVYNDVEAIEELCKQIPFKAFNIANNHLLDNAEVKITLDNVKRLGIPVVGAGQNLQEAQKSIVITDSDGVSYRILAFGWENIQCEPAGKNKQGVNPYTKKNVLKCVHQALKEKEPVICFMHWDFELEQYPMPLDRSLSHELIDLGVSAIVGCHGHRVQQIEFYKDRPIVYGMGNFLFRQGVYYDGKLKYPALSNEEWAFEINGNRQFLLHRFEYDNNSHNLKYIGEETLSPPKMYYGKAPYNDYNNEDYLNFFRKNRKVNKLLPIFTHRESAVSYWMKSGWIKMRGWLLDTAQNLKLKSANRG